MNNTPCMAQLIDNFNKYGRSTIAVEEVPYEKLSSYGIIKGRPVDDSLYILEDIVEKPAPEDAPSRMGAIGRYVFTSEIFDCIKATDEGVGNEIQLTDGIRVLNRIQKVYAYEFKGKRFDTGDRLGYVKATLEFALKHEEIKDDVLEYIKGLIPQEKVFRGGKVKTENKETAE